MAENLTRMSWPVLIGLLCLTEWIILAAEAAEAGNGDSGTSSFSLHSKAFEPGDSIPAKYTCDGENISPPLYWKNVPIGTRSMVLICENADANEGAGVHWLLYNIPPYIVELNQGVSKEMKPANDMRQGVNDFGGIGYEGPCPEEGPHRYIFRLIALDTETDPEKGMETMTREDMIAALQGHVLAETVLMGTYNKKKEVE